MSRSLGQIVRVCEGFASDRGQTHRKETIYPQISAISGCEPRFRTTFSIFGFFFPGGEWQYRNLSEYYCAFVTPTFLPPQLSYLLSYLTHFSSRLALGGSYSAVPT